ncbi:MAG: alpha-amylase family glycosyl hydrolase [Pseudomonadota bacterium]
MEDLKTFPFFITSVILERHYPHGWGQFFRTIAHEKMTLSLSAHVKAISKVRLNLQGNKQKKNYLFHKKINGNKENFSLHFEAPRPGNYHLQVEYLSTKQKKWCLDQTSHLIVDPPGVLGSRLYTMIPSVCGKISDWIKDLPRIKKMGFNAIHLLPITRMGKSQSPYSAYDLLSIDPLFITSSGKSSPMQGLAQFSKFVKECKKLQIKLCLDLALNHVAFDSLIVKKHPNWIVPDPKEKDKLKRAGWRDHLGVWHPWGDLTLLNYQHRNPTLRRQIWKTMEKYALLWANFAAQTDGMIRLDNLHSSDFPFLQKLLPKMRRRFPNLIFFAEFFAEEKQREEWCQKLPLNILVATPWDNAYPQQTRNHLVWVHQNFYHYRYLTGLTSHDSATPLQVYGAVETTLPRYSIYALLTPGLTGITQGVEYGNQEKINFIGGPYNWKVNCKTGINYQKEFALINSLIERHPFFSQAGNILFLDRAHPFIICALRFDSQKKNRSFLIAANLDTLRPQTLRLSNKKVRSYTLGRFQNLLTGEILKLEGGMTSLKLPPNGFLIAQSIGGVGTKSS